MSQEPEALYLGLLVFFLVLMRSPWPWTRFGGILLGGLGISSFGLLLWRRPAAFDAILDPRRLPAVVLVLMTLLVIWWSLFSARQPMKSGVPEPTDPASSRSSRIRFLGIAVGLLTVAMLALTLGAPRPELPPGEQVPWFFAGLAALAPMTGQAFAWLVVPFVALVGLLLAPDLDAHPGELGAAGDAPAAPGTGAFQTEAVGTGAFETGILPAVQATDGRRDEVPFFLFAWLAVGVLPIGLAVWRPDFGAAPAPHLSQLFWLDWLGLAMPEFWALREAPGILLYLVLFVGLPARLPKWKASKGVFGRHLRRLGPARYGLVTTLTGVLLLVPVKIALYFLFGIGPWIGLGGFEL